MLSFLKSILIMHRLLQGEFWVASNKKYDRIHAREWLIIAMVLSSIITFIVVAEVKRRVFRGVIKHKLKIQEKMFVEN